MKSRFFVVLFSIFLLTSIASSVSASENNVIDFREKHLSSDILVDYALDGYLVNNEHTEVSQIIDIENKTKIIKIDKKLSEQSDSDGNTTSENTLETYIFPENAKIPSVNEGEITPLATLPGEVNDPSYAVGLKIVMTYTQKSLGGFTTRLLTNVSVTPKRYDSSFNMTEAEYQFVTAGTGWLANGNMHTNGEMSKLYTLAPVVYDVSNSHTTNFVKYVPINTDVFGVATVRTKFSYRRGNGTIYTTNANLYVNQ